MFTSRIEDTDDLILFGGCRSYLSSLVKFEVSEKQLYIWGDKGCLTGKRGGALVMLPTIYVGTRRLTSVQALRTFAATLTRLGGETPAGILPPEPSDQEPG